ncbi:hypothetical protein EGI16_14600 [Chryseobacterium sp. G0240]|uniref:hypothetical protein n=1 Tax=Chryseobacterium sp. G0240 TaxID=2487066 RepID=UPI000F45D304|nr:hypothetical protein [Chryseobacterium sp. G0240]ROI02111.1 hypothetical protein EGI16_14600 [Chryseobacterium sp. G0240]
MKKSYIILIISLFIFIISLIFPAVYTKDSEVYGLACFLLGWAEMDGGGIAWLANPLLFVTAIFLLLKKIKISAVLSLLTFCLTLCFLSVNEITVDEAGHKSLITGYGYSYFLWMASALTLFIGTLILLKYPEKLQTDTPV